MENDDQLLTELTNHGESLAIGMGITVGEYLGAPDAECNHSGVTIHPAGEAPEDAPKQGILLRYTGQLAAPSEASALLGAFAAEAIRDKIVEQAGDESADKISALAGEMNDILATDKYTLETADGKLSEDLWNDFVGEESLEDVFWQKFTFASAGVDDAPFYLLWPRNVIARMFGPAEPVTEAPATAPAEAQPAVQAPAPPPPAQKLSPRILRLLQTEVPIIVTLATKQENGGKLLQLGPGSIIEFEQSCEEPLQLSVNNLPIGLGEAVKIGDHFGLKIVSICPAAERVERLGGKWQF